MAIFFDAPVPPEALTAFVRQVPVNAGRALLGQIPTVEVDSNTIRWGDITRTNRTAKFRAFDGSIAKSKRDGASDSEVRLIPLGSTLDVGEYERLQIEFARTGGTNLALLERAIYDDAEQLTHEVYNRLELAVGRLLATGKLTINENGYQGEADFGVPGTQKHTAGTAWTNVSTALAFTDLKTWNSARVSNGNGRAEVIRTSERIRGLYLRNAEVIETLYGTGSSRTWASLADVNALHLSEDLPPFTETFDESLDVDGVTTQVIPDDILLFTPRNLGEVVDLRVGVSATALELVDSNKADFSFEDAAGLAGVVVKDGPPYRQTTFVDGVAMPIMTSPKKISIADVF